MDLKINEKDCRLRDLKVPEGYRIIEDWEVLRELRTNKKLRKLLTDGLVACNRVIRGKKVVRACLLNSFFGPYFNANDWKVYYDSAVRGVFVKKMKPLTEKDIHLIIGIGKGREVLYPDSKILGAIELLKSKRHYDLSTKRYAVFIEDIDEAFQI